MKIQSLRLSTIILAFGGVLLMAMGVYFIFLRPVLLPEDLRYMNTNILIIQKTIPGLADWLSKVFWVMGSYIFTTGLLTVFISLTSLRIRAHGAFGIVAISGITSIGIMTLVNFVIGSDFKWFLLFLTLPWIFALILYRLNK